MNYTWQLRHYFSSNAQFSLKLESEIMCLMPITKAGYISRFQ